MVKVTSASYEREVLNNKGIVIVKFARSKGCSNCEKVAPIFEAFAKKHKEIKCVHIEADENKDIKLPVAFKTLPGIFIFENGQFLGNLEGAVTMEDLEGALEFARASLTELKARAYDLSVVINEGEKAKLQIQAVNNLIITRTKLDANKFITQK